MNTKINIDCSQISELEKRLLASSLLEDLIKHFEDPENQKRFKEWQKQRREEEAKKEVKGGMKYA